MATIADVPAYHLFMWPIVERLRAKGRSMTIEEMVDDVATYMGLSDEARAVTHGKWQENAVAYRMAWARSYLKKMGALVNSERGVWTLTPKGAAMTEAEIAGIKQAVQKLGAAERAANAALASAVEDDPVPADVGADDWKDRLMALLLALEPAAFERLCQRLLREFGFIKVEVTGKSGDGGIDGTVSLASSKSKSLASRATAASTGRAYCGSICCPSTSCSSANVIPARSAPGRSATSAAPWSGGPTRD